jgi:hypothetical protein
MSKLAANFVVIKPVLAQQRVPSCSDVPLISDVYKVTKCCQVKRQCHAKHLWWLSYSVCIQQTYVTCKDSCWCKTLKVAWFHFVELTFISFFQPPVKYCLQNCILIMSV